MKKGRIKVDANDVATRQQAEMVLGEHARLTVQLETLEAEQSKDILEVCSKYEGRIEALKEKLKSKTKLLNTWATNNEAEFPKNKKSIDFIFGRIGFRTTTLKVSYLKKSKADFILKMLKPMAPNYVRTKEEINKDAIIEDYAKAEKAKKPEVLAKLVAKLKNFDLKVGRSETFYVEPKLDASQEDERRAAS